MYKDTMHASDTETYRPIAEIMENQKSIESETRKAGKTLEKILEKKEL